MQLFSGGKGEKEGEKRGGRGEGEVVTRLKHFHTFRNMYTVMRSSAE